MSHSVVPNGSFFHPKLSFSFFSFSMVALDLAKIIFLIIAISPPIININPPTNTIAASASFPEQERLQDIAKTNIPNPIATKIEKKIARNFPKSVMPFSVFLIFLTLFLILFRSCCFAFRSCLFAFRLLHLFLCLEQLFELNILVENFVEKMQIG